MADIPVGYVSSYGESIGEHMARFEFPYSVGVGQGSDENVFLVAASGGGRRRSVLDHGGG